MKSALYAGRVAHARLRPKRHRLSYRVFLLLLDLDEIDELAARLRLFRRNRTGLFAFFDRDHGNGDGKLGRWVTEQLAEAGITLTSPRISMLCYPRILGYVFNPLTVYFCADGDALRAIFYEVHNTFGERRTYVIPVADGSRLVEQSCDKELYVSPFVPMDCNYRFSIETPGQTVAIRIAEIDAQGLLLTASFAGERRELTDGTLLRAFFSYPLMTLKVTVAIHWEALKLWTKGVPVFRHRAAAAGQVATTIVTPVRASESSHA